MSADIGNPKRINLNVPMDLYLRFTNAGYEITKGTIEAWEMLLDGEKEPDCEQITNELENRVLAAETRTEAKDRVIIEQTKMIEEYKIKVSKLNNKVKLISEVKNGKIKTLTTLLIGFSLASIIFIFIILYEVMI